MGDLAYAVLAWARGEVALGRLLDNAWKSTEGRQGARIEVSKVYDGGPVTYYVWDNGVGFDMAYTDKLLDASGGLNAPWRFDGPGMGLPVAQRVVALHGGRIWAEACEGAGATFYLTLRSPEPSR